MDRGIGEIGRADKKVKHFHVTLHNPQQPAPRAIGCLQWNERSFATLDIAAARLSEPFATSFEKAASQFSTFERFYLEPDGSFVWTGESANHDRWQLDGSLFDRRDRLQYVELNGSCTEQAFLQLCDVLRSKPHALIVQLVRQAVYLNECEFRRLAFGESSE